MFVQGKSIVGAGLVQGTLVGQRREHMAPGGGVVGSRTRGFMRRMVLPVGCVWGCLREVGNCRTSRLEREGFFLPGCGAWTLSCRPGVRAIRSDFTGMREAVLRRGPLPRQDEL